MKITRLFEILFRKIKRFILNNKYKSILQKHEVIYSTLTFNGYIKFVLDLGCFSLLGKTLSVAVVLIIALTHRVSVL